jgi:hypothetical protein
MADPSSGPDPAPRPEDEPAGDVEEPPELRERVREALQAEGFRWELWQKPKRGVVFGLIRREDENLQTHVRYYEGGVVKSEREIANDYLEHLVSPRESAHEEVQRLLEEHGVTEVEVSEKDFPDRMDRDMPSTRTPWKPLVVGAGALLAGAIVGARALSPFGDD